MPGAVRTGQQGFKKKLTDDPELRFALFLARTLGRTLEELGETCSAWEFGLHQADYETSPWGPLREDLAAGVIASTLANIHRSKDAAELKPLDFMPYVQAQREEAAPAAAEPTGADFVKDFG